MPTLSIPDAANGDNVLNDQNAMRALVEASYNNLDGANIMASTVATTSLAKPKAWIPFVFRYDAIAATVVRDKFTLPNIDGASSSTWRFLGYSINSRVLTTPVGTLDIRKDGVSMLAAVANFATLVAGTPTVALEVTPDSLTSANVVDVNIAYTSGTITDTTLIMFFSLNHVGT